MNKNEERRKRELAVMMMMMKRVIKKRMGSHIRFLQFVRIMKMKYGGKAVLKSSLLLKALRRLS